MEGSRRGKGSREKGFPIPDPHVDGGNGVKTIVYNTKKGKKAGGGGGKKTKEGKERKIAKRLKKYNSKKEEFSTLSSSTRACPKMLFACVRAFNPLILMLYTNIFILDSD